MTGHFGVIEMSAGSFLFTVLVTISSLGPDLTVRVWIQVLETWETPTHLLSQILPLLSSFLLITKIASNILHFYGPLYLELSTL